MATMGLTFPKAIKPFHLLDNKNIGNKEQKQKYGVDDLHPHNTLLVPRRYFQIRNKWNYTHNFLSNSRDHSIFKLIHHLQEIMQNRGICRNVGSDEGDQKIIVSFINDIVTEIRGKPLQNRLKTIDPKDCMRDEQESVLRRKKKARGQWIREGHTSNFRMNRRITMVREIHAILPKWWKFDSTVPLVCRSQLRLPVLLDC